MGQLLFSESGCSGSNPILSRTGANCTDFLRALKSKVPSLLYFWWTSLSLAWVHPSEGMFCRLILLARRKNQSVLKRLIAAICKAHTFFCLILYHQLLRWLDFVTIFRTIWGCCDLATTNVSISVNFCFLPESSCSSLSRRLTVRRWHNHILRLFEKTPSHIWWSIVLISTWTLRDIFLWQVTGVNFCSMRRMWSLRIWLT